MKTYQVEVEILETYIVQADSWELACLDAQNRALALKRPFFFEIVSIVAEENEEPKIISV
jgi:hypothetical protein